MKKEKIIITESSINSCAICEEDLDKVIGGANPFQNKKRVEVSDYDEEVKETV